MLLLLPTSSLYCFSTMLNLIDSIAGDGCVWTQDQPSSTGLRILPTTPPAWPDQGPSVHGGWDEKPAKFSFFFLAQLHFWALQCAGGHIYCGACTRRHEKACISNCRLLDRTIAQMKFKCIFCDSGGEYIPYCKFFEHRCNTDVVDPKLPEQQMEFAFYGGGYIKTSLLVYSECELPLRPPIFRVSSALTWPN